ncbi:uncharacterized protein LOC143291224 [Babylonia areolata]|uniref:uncharacterized protein LOC143291224 n=1 Tax=Babylonia areolata TaxID=304850 RepID=UPI003FD21AB5
MKPGDGFVRWLVLGSLILGNTVSLARAQPEARAAQCQPCRNSEQYVQCRLEEDGCPDYYHVADRPGGAIPGAGDCRLPLSSTASITTTAENATEDWNETTDAETSTPETTSEADPGLDFPTSDPFDNSTDNTDTVNPQPPAPTSPPTPTATCPICLENCRTCNRSECLECREDHEFHESGSQRKRCVPKKKKTEDSEISIAIIAGASAGGGALLLVVVVVVVCCVCSRRRRGCCRRRGEEEGEERGGGGGGRSHDLAMDEMSPPSRCKEEDTGSEVDVVVRPKGSHKEVPDYVNFNTTLPRPISIERGHDKVTRYVRDPTVKKPEPPMPATEDEEKELDELPPAPLPPTSPPDGGDRPARRHNPQPVRSHTTLETTTTRPPGRGRRPGHSGASTPHSASAESLPTSTGISQLPKFPIEEEIQARKAAPPPKVRPPPALVKEEEELEDPEMDYENMEKLKHAAGKTSGGVSNPGLDVEEEEPEDEYSNRAAIEEARQQDEDNPYQNWPYKAPR